MRREQSGKCDDFLLATTQLADWLGPVGFRHAEPCEDFRPRERNPVVAHIFDAGQGKGVLVHDGGELIVVQGLAHSQLEPGKVQLERVWIAGREGNGFQHGHFRIDRGFLMEVPDTHSAPHSDRASLRGELTRKQPKEGRFSRPIGTEQG